MATETDVLSEIEVLQSIYLDELRATRKDAGGWEVSLVLYPSTGEDCLSQFVRLTLTLDLDSEYPASPPCISIHRPRGLSDDKLHSLQQSLQAEAESCLGMPVLYQLIEKAKEILTESNIPHGNCVICLYGFKEGEVFTKTSCYHYFHSHCLGRYVTHSEVELRVRVRELEEDKSRGRVEEEEELFVVCPVCREPLTYDVNALLSSAAPNFPQQEDEAVHAEFKRKWASFQKILERQKEKGGVIDPEAESKRFLIHINDAPADFSDTLCSDALTSDPSDPDVPPAAPPAAPDSPAQNHTPRAEVTTNPSLGDFRGGRRGRGRGQRALRGIPPPEPDEFAKPGPSSTESKPIKNGLPTQNNGAQVERTGQEHSLQLRVTRDHSVKPEEQDCIATHHQEPLASKDMQPIRKSNSNVSDGGARRIVTDGQQERGPWDRGRSRGPRGARHGQWHERNPRDSTQWDGAGGMYHHRGGRGHRARAGGFANHQRGGGLHRVSGPLKSTGKGVHQKTECEFRKEELL